MQEYTVSQPWISEKTVRLHYFKHHLGYYTMLRAYIREHPEYQQKTVEELVRINKGGILLDEDIFNISVLLYNHNCYWPSLSPSGGGVPKGKIAAMINDAYGSYNNFRDAFMGSSIEPGDGWIWVVQSGKGLKVQHTRYHDSPLLKEDLIPVLAIDIWEHAYFLDYQNDRGKYIAAVLDHLINWPQAEKNISGTSGME